MAVDYGTATENPLVVSFRNDSDNVYTIILECMTKSFSLKWRSDSPQFIEETFSPSSKLLDPNSVNIQGITLLHISRDNLSDGENYLYVSQLRVSTSSYSCRYVTFLW